MIYKRPSDFIPRKPSRSFDESGYDSSSSSEDMILSLPQDKKHQPLLQEPARPSSPRSSNSSFGRWASSSSIDYFHYDQPETAASRPTEDAAQEHSSSKARKRVSFHAVVEVRSVPPRQQQGRRASTGAIVFDQYEALKEF